MRKLSSKYAREHGVTEVIYEEMKRLDDAFKAHPEFSKVLGNRLFLLRTRYGIVIGFR